MKYLLTTFTTIIAVGMFVSTAFAAEVGPGEIVSFANFEKTSPPVRNCNEGLVDEYDCEFLTPNLNLGKFYVYVGVITGVDTDISAQQSVYSEFSVSPGSNRVLGAQITGSVEYDGTLLAPFPERTSIAIVVQLYDRTAERYVGSQTILDETCDGRSSPPACGSSPQGTGPVNFTASLTRGHDYELYVRATCEAHNSLASPILCDFDSTTGSGFIKWGGLTVSVEPDVIEELGAIKSLLIIHDQEMKSVVSQHDQEMKSVVSQHDQEMKSVVSQHDQEMKSVVSQHDQDIKSVVSQHDQEMKSVVSQHDQEMKSVVSQHDQDIKSLIASLDGKVDENNAAILETIRLLLTPQGQRESELVDCNDEPGCDFPRGRNK